MWWKPKPRSTGQRGEDAAARYLRKHGYTILERNVRLGRNEVDIIARDGDTIAFVEVRSRTETDAIPPEDTVGPRKQQHLRTAAHIWLGQHQQAHLNYRFDVVGVILPERGRAQCTLYQDAFH